MRIVILSGAFLLATSVLASAATVRFSYETDTLTLVSEGTGYPIDPSEYNGGKIDARFDIKVSSINNISYNLSFFNGDIIESGGSVISGYVDQAASVFGLSVLPGYASFKTDGEGNILEASAAGFGDSPDVAISGSFATLAQSTAGVIYSGVGDWSVSVIEPSPVPLPATAPLIVLALGALGWIRRQRS